MLTAVLRRPARDVDIAELTSAVTSFRAVFQDRPDAAQELINTGESRPDVSLDTIELAAWTMVANTIMNRDDLISK